MGGLFNQLAVPTALLASVVLGLVGVLLAIQVGARSAVRRRPATATESPATRPTQ